MAVQSWINHTNIALQWWYKDGLLLPNNLATNSWLSFGMRPNHTVSSETENVNRAKRQGCFPEAENDTTGDRSKLVLGNVTMKTHQEVARRTIIASNCDGALGELKRPNSDHACRVSAEPLSKPTELHHCNREVNGAPPHSLRSENYSLRVR